MNQINWINIIKGIGILSVVIGHIYTGEIRQYIYMFHMPLFFFISGYLYNYKSDLKVFFFKKTKSLLIPYFVFLIPLYLYSYGLPNGNYHDISIYIKRLLLGGSFLIGNVGPLWFITCLFITQQLINLNLHLFSIQLTTYIVGIMLCLSFVNDTVIPEFWLPWSANVVLASAPIYFLGYLFKLYEVKINKPLIYLLCISILLLRYKLPDNVYDMKIIEYGIPFITFLSSIIIVLCIKELSVIISKIKIINKALIELGKASMVIMCMHIFFQIRVRDYITDNEFIRSVVSIIASYILFIAFNKFILTRALFLGNVDSIKVLYSKVIKLNFKR